MNLVKHNTSRRIWPAPTDAARVRRRMKWAMARIAGVSAVAIAGFASTAAATDGPSSQTASCPNSEGTLSCSVSVFGTSFETRMTVGSSQTSGTLSIAQDAPAAISCAGVPLAEDGDTWSFGGNSPVQSLTVHEHFSDNSGTGNFCYASLVPFLTKPGTVLSLQVVSGRLQFVGALARCLTAIPGLPFPLVPPCIESSSASDIVASILIDAHGRG